MTKVKTKVEIRFQSECFDWSEWFGLADIQAESPEHVRRYAVASVKGPFPVCTILHRHDGSTDFMGRNV